MCSTAGGRLTPIPFDTPVITYTDILSDLIQIRGLNYEMDCKIALKPSCIYILIYIHTKLKSHFAADMRMPRASPRPLYYMFVNFKLPNNLSYLINKKLSVLDIDPLEMEVFDIAD
jgi:hypothetical protein